MRPFDDASTGMMAQAGLKDGAREFHSVSRRLARRLMEFYTLTNPSTPAAPWLAFTRLKASQTSRLGMSNGFTLSTGSSRCQLTCGLG